MSKSQTKNIIVSEELDNKTESDNKKESNNKTENVEEEFADYLNSFISFNINQ